MTDNGKYMKWGKTHSLGVMNGSIGESRGSKHTHMDKHK